MIAILFFLYVCKMYKMFPEGEEVVGEIIKVDLK